MNRFLPSGSLLSNVVAWVFAAALSADAANLDDVFSPTIVLHDDWEIAGSLLESCQNTVVAEHLTVRTATRTHLVSQTVRKNPFRVIIDQDSPSLAADGFHGHGHPLAFSNETSATPPDRHLPSELLHIRFRSLLI